MTVIENFSGIIIEKLMLVVTHTFIILLGTRSVDLKVIDVHV